MFNAMCKVPDKFLSSHFVLVVSRAATGGSWRSRPLPLPLPRQDKHAVAREFRTYFSVRLLQRTLGIVLLKAALCIRLVINLYSTYCVCFTVDSHFYTCNLDVCQAAVSVDFSILASVRFSLWKNHS